MLMVLRNLKLVYVLVSRLKLMVVWVVLFLVCRL